MSSTRMTTLAFLLLELAPICFVWNRFRVRSRFKSNTLWNILVVLGRTVGQD